MAERIVVVTPTCTFLRVSVRQYCQVMSGQSLKLLVALSTISVGVEQVCIVMLFWPSGQYKTHLAAGGWRRLPDPPRKPLRLIIKQDRGAWEIGGASFSLQE